MSVKPRDVISIFKNTISQWSADKAPKMAAAMAYYAVFSMGPILLLSISIASVFFGEENARQQMLTQITSLVGASSSDAIAQMLQNIRESQSGGTMAVVGILTLLLAAGGVFGELQDSLNNIWEVRPAKAVGLKGFLKKRLLSFGMVFSIGFLLLISLIITSLLEAGIKYAGDFLPGGGVIWQILSFLVSFTLFSGLFACMFRYLPDGKLNWKDALVGSSLTSALFTIGKFGISFYLANSAVASNFGAAATLAILLLWIYYSAQIFFFGAEFTLLYAEKYGQGITLNAGAVRTDASTFEPRKELSMKSVPNKNYPHKLRSFDDALKEIQATEQPLKNELLNTKLSMARIMKARKYYIWGSAALAIVTYFVQMYRRKKYAKAN